MPLRYLLHTITAACVALAACGATTSVAQAASQRSLPDVAAACGSSFGIDKSPPRTVAPGEAMTSTWSVTCLTPAKVTLEIVRITGAGSWLSNPALRTTVIAEHQISTSASGSSTWNVPAGATNDGYGAILRIYSSPTLIDSSGANTFTVVGSDACPNVDGVQPSVPADLVKLPDGSCVPYRADVLFLFDTTGSTDPVIDSNRAFANDIMNRIRGSIGDSHFAIADFGDYDDDAPWHLAAPMSSDIAAVSAGSASLLSRDGLDLPEAHARALFDSVVRPEVGWRSDARRVVVLLTDDVPHDDDINAGVPGTTGTNDTGNDPGWDAHDDTPDDIDWQTMLHRTADAGTTLVTVYTPTKRSGFLDHWRAWSAITGGTASTPTDSLVDTTLSLVKYGSANTLPACSSGAARDASFRCPLPVPTTSAAPTITGSITAGRQVHCDAHQGAWSNAWAWTTTWLLNGRKSSTDPDFSIPSSAAGKKLVCRVEGWNARGHGTSATGTRVPDGTSIGGGPADAPCTSSTTLTVGVARIRGCFVRVNAQQRATRSPVDIHGVRITPLRGGTLVLDLKRKRLVTTRTASVGIGKASLIINPINVPLTGSFQLQMGKHSLLQKVRLFGIDVDGTMIMKLASDHGGTADLTLQASLSYPEAIKAKCGSSTSKEDGTMGTGDLHVKLSRARGIEQASLKVDEVSFGCLRGISLRGFHGEYDDGGLDAGKPGSATWGGGAQLGLPIRGVPSLISGSATFGASPFSFRGAEVEWKNDAKFTVGSSTRIDRIAAGIELDPFGFSGGVGATFGPALHVSAAGDWDIRALSVDGTARYSSNDRCAEDKSMPRGHLLQLKDVSAELVHFEAFDKTGSLGKGTLDLCAMLDTLYVVGDGSITIDTADLIGGPHFGYEGKLGVVVDSKYFQADGEGKAMVPGLPDPDAKVRLSERGVAACGKVAWKKIGYVWKFKDKLPRISCDMEKIKSKASGADLPASARTGGSTPFEYVISRATESADFAMTGSATAPRLHILGPGGRVIDTPAPSATGVVTDQYIVTWYGTTTWVSIKDPARGTWSVTALDGGAITTADAAIQARPANVKARVSVRGRRAHLAYSWGAGAGRTVQFVERTGRSARVIATTTRARGAITFTPTASTFVRRRIYARVLDDGVPVGGRFVTAFSFRAVAPPARAARVSVRRTNGHIVARWRRAARAVRYEVTIHASDGRLWHRTVRRVTRVNVRVPGRDHPRLIASVVSIDRFGQRSRAALARG